MTPIPHFSKTQLQGISLDDLQSILHVLHFGALAATSTLPDTPPDPTTLGLKDLERQQCWRNAIAEELLLRQQFANVPPNWLHAFADEAPFVSAGCQTTLAAFSKLDSACAVFPLLRDPSPQAGRVWCIAGIDTPLRIAHVPWNGRSYQLAQAMAQRALTHADPTLKRRLAIDWICSGTLADDQRRLSSIEIGNKLQLCQRSPELQRRTWLLPSVIREALPTPFPGANGYRLAHDLDTAWNHITGQGTLRAHQGQWPMAHAFHSFCSGSRRPVIAAALLSRAAAPAIALQLWHSEADFSQTRAQEVGTMLAQLGAPCKNPHRLASSRDMITAEQQLARQLSPDLANGQTVIFNVTQGNRLMSFAVHSLARRFENLFMIYRDLDASPHEFSMIHYANGQPITQTITGNPTHDDWDWTVLYAKGPEPEYQELLNQFRK